MGCCCNGGICGIVMLAFVDAFMALVVLLFFAYIFFIRAVAEAFVFFGRRPDTETYWEDNLETYLYITLVFGIIHGLLEIVLIVGAIQKNRICCWLWIIGTGAFFIIYIVVLFYITPVIIAAVVSLLIVTFKAYSIFVVWKLIKKITKKLNNNNADVHLPSIVVQPSPIYLVPDQNYDNQTSQNSQKNSALPLEDNEGINLPPPYTSLYLVPDENKVKHVE